MPPIVQYLETTALPPIAQYLGTNALLTINGVAVSSISDAFAKFDTEIGAPRELNDQGFNRRSNEKLMTLAIK